MPDLFYVEDQEIDLNEVIKQAGHHLKVPLDVTWTAHWLAIEGIQPAIPQNPPPTDPIASTLSAIIGDQTHTTTTTTNLKTTHNSSSSNYIPNSSKSTTGVGVAPTPVQLKPMVQHHLSKELQMYYDKLVSAILRVDTPELQKVAFDSLAGDVGLSMLLPYIVKWMSDKVTHNLHKMEITSAVLSSLEALLKNPNIFIEPYVKNAAQFFNKFCLNILTYIF